MTPVVKPLAERAVEAATPVVKAGADYAGRAAGPIVQYAASKVSAAGAGNWTRVQLASTGAAAAPAAPSGLAALFRGAEFLQARRDAQK